MFKIFFGVFFWILVSLVGAISFHPSNWCKSLRQVANTCSSLFWCKSLYTETNIFQGNRGGYQMLIQTVCIWWWLCMLFCKPITPQPNSYPSCFCSTWRLICWFNLSIALKVIWHENSVFNNVVLQKGGYDLVHKMGALVRDYIEWIAKSRAYIVIEKPHCAIGSIGVDGFGFCPFCGLIGCNYNVLNFCLISQWFD